MADQIIVTINDKAAADALQRELASYGISAARLSPKQATQFGMKLSAGRGSLEASPQEIIEFVLATPVAVGALFDTFEKFRDRIRIFVNGRPKELPSKGSLARKPTFEEFMRGM